MKQLALALVALICATGALAQTVGQTSNSSVIIGLTSTYFRVILSAVTGLDQRRSLTIQNNNINGDRCWISTEVSATSARSILLFPGGSYERYWPMIPSDAIRATCDTSPDSLYIDVQ